MTNSVPIVPLVPLHTGNETQHLTQIATSLNLALQGKLNALAQVTLNAGASNTIVSDARIGSQSCLLLMPRSLSAANALATLYVQSLGKGSAILQHANSVAADQNFTVAIIG